MTKLLFLVIFLYSCEFYSTGDCYYSRLDYPYVNIDSSEVEVSPNLGFGWLNDTDYSVDIVGIEERLLTMQEDIRSICWSFGGKLDPSWDCFRSKLNCDDQFDWSCLKFKIVKPVKSECTTMGDGTSEVPVELLDVVAPESGCLSKGLKTTSECPCRYRMIQQGNIVITPPTVYLYDLIERFTTCRNYWNSPFKEVAYNDMRRAKQLPRSMW